MSSFALFHFQPGDERFVGRFIGTKACNLKELSKKTSNCRFTVLTQGIEITGRSAVACDSALKLVTQQFQLFRNPTQFNITIQIGTITNDFFHNKLCTLVRGTKVAYDQPTRTLSVYSHDNSLLHTFSCKLNQLLVDIKTKREKDLFSAQQQAIADNDAKIKAEEKKVSDEQLQEERTRHNKSKKKIENAKKRARKKVSKLSKAQAPTLPKVATTPPSTKVYQSISPPSFQEMVSKKSIEAPPPITSGKKRKRQQRSTTVMSLKEWYL